MSCGSLHTAYVASIHVSCKKQIIDLLGTVGSDRHRLKKHAISGIYQLIHTRRLRTSFTYVFRATKFRRGVL